MRCPNCGNENPADYVFCDECGARLQNVGSAEAEAAITPASATSSGPTGGDSGGGQWQPSGGLVGSSSTAGGGDFSAIPSFDTSGPIGDSGSVDSTSTGGFGGSSIDSGTLVGASMDNDAGTSIGMSGSLSSDTGGASSEYAMPSGGASEGEPVDQAASVDSQATEAQPSSADTALDDATVPAYDYEAWQPTGMDDASSTSSPAMEQEASQGDPADDATAATPVTEDTVSAAPAETEESAAQDSGPAAEEETSLPDVIPIVGSYSDADVAGTPAVSGALSGATDSGTASASSGGGGEWASSALTYLNQAQQAAGQGDWSGFGAALNSLRSYLQSASQGGTGAGAGMTMQAQSPSVSSTADTSAGTSSTDIGSSTTSDTYGSYTSSPIASEQASGSDTADTGVHSYDSMPASPMSGDESMQSAPLGGAHDVDVSSVGSAAATLEPAADAGSLGAIPLEEAPVVEVNMARLVMIATGAELPLPDQEEILVGREDPSSGIFPDIDLTPYGGEDGGVSRRHSRLLHIGDDFFVEDLQSTNYTKLDGQRLPAHVRERLEDGARLDFGRVATIFRRS